MNNNEKISSHSSKSQLLIRNIYLDMAKIIFTFAVNIAISQLIGEYMTL